MTRQQLVEEAGRLVGDLRSHVEDYTSHGDGENFVRFTRWFIRELENLFLDYDGLWADGLAPGCGLWRFRQWVLKELQGMGLLSSCCVRCVVRALIVC